MTTPTKHQRQRWLKLSAQYDALARDYANRAMEEERAGFRKAHLNWASHYAKKAAEFLTKATVVA